jgi:hypothetical protein
VFIHILTVPNGTPSHQAPELWVITGWDYRTKTPNSEAIASAPKHDGLNREDVGKVLSQKFSFQTLQINYFEHKPWGQKNQNRLTRVEEEI